MRYTMNSRALTPIHLAHSRPCSAPLPPWCGLCTKQASRQSGGRGGFTSGAPATRRGARRSCRTLTLRANRPGSKRAARIFLTRSWCPTAAPKKLRWQLKLLRLRTAGGASLSQRAVGRGSCRRSLPLTHGSCKQLQLAKTSRTGRRQEASVLLTARYVNLMRL